MRRSLPHGWESKPLVKPRKCHPERRDPQALSSGTPKERLLLFGAELGVVSEGSAFPSFDLRAASGCPIHVAFFAAWVGKHGLRLQPIRVHSRHQSMKRTRPSLSAKLRPCAPSSFCLLWQSPHPSRTPHNPLRKIIRPSTPRQSHSMSPTSSSSTPSSTPAKVLRKTSRKRFRPSPSAAASPRHWQQRGHQASRRTQYHPPRSPLRQRQHLPLSRIQRRPHASRQRRPHQA